MKKSILLGLAGVVTVVIVVILLRTTSLRSQTRSVDQTTSYPPIGETTPFARQFEFTATQSGQTALELLMEHTLLETNDYAYGTMVIAIDGLVADANNYWAFYINGEYAKQSVDKTILNAGDTIRFVYEPVSGAAAMEK